MNSAELYVVKKDTFVLIGELTFSSVPSLWHKSGSLLGNVASPAGEIVIDLDKVVRTDSAGLALMIEWRRQANDRNIILRFRNVRKQMLSLAKMAEVDFLFRDDFK